MERFNYANLEAVYAEDASILQLLALESYGDKRDEEEKLDAMEEEINRIKAQGESH